MKVRFIIILLILVVSPHVCAEVELMQSSKALPDDQFLVTVRVNGSENEMQSIQKVTYRLGSESSQQQWTNNDVKNGFAFHYVGKVEQTLYAYLVFNDGHSLNLDLTLRFDRPMAMGMSNFSSLEGGSRIVSKREGWWTWRVFLKGNKGDLDAIEKVGYTLHPTFHDPYREVNERGAEPDKGWYLKDFTAYGTFPIKIKLIFKDGTERVLWHSTSFDDPMID